MPETALVPIADGTEEIEAVCIIDVLRRADVAVTVASVTGALQITASRGVNIVADALIEECVDQSYDLMALPGGIPGAEHLRDSEALVRLLTRHIRADRLYGAICASPAVVLEHHGLLPGRQAACHPSFADHISQMPVNASRVVVDGQCVTSQGPGTALEFSLKLVEMLMGAEKAASVAAPMVMK